MAPKRGVGYANTLSPDVPPSPGPSSPLSPTFPRSTSPSSGLAQFLARPSKWFTRSASVPKLQSPSPELPRPSMGSGRKHKISHPQDPRPILDNYGISASKSVLDLSIRPPGSYEDSSPHPTSTPSTPVVSPVTNAGHEIGDLRAISRKGWSRSADDLSHISPVPSSPGQASFQNKVAEYRNRSNSSASAMSAGALSPTLVNRRHPFPSAKTVSPSGSPSQTSVLASVSISVSAPTIEETNHGSVTEAEPHVHGRSRSFTPKQPSKLSSPQLVPTSPKRKGSIPTTPSETNTRLGDSDKFAAPNRSSTFPFFNSPTNDAKSVPETIYAPNSDVQQPAVQPMQPSTLLAPPPINELAGQEDSDSKRSSQIVYHSGFVNRLSDMPNHHHGNISLSKGWKPFKLELKGSKLHFYKPPSDRNTAAKDLFPTGLVPPMMEEQDDLNMDGVTLDEREASGVIGRGRSGSVQGMIGKKKRAFWGRRTHPDLVLNADDIERGSFEALVHEAVFGTIFSSGEMETDEVQQKRTEEWKNFASAIVLCLPSIVGQAKFEAEFLRCCSFLVSGAPDDEQEMEQERVAWLVKEYLRYHGSPIDSNAWEEWRKETLPNHPLSINPPLPPALPMSVSTQAMLHPSPMLSSPNIGTFSPRPGDPQPTVSLLSALDAQDAITTSPSRSVSTDSRTFEHPPTLPPTGTPNSRFPWVALEHEGLSRDVLLQLDPHFIARSLILFHRSILEHLPENMTADFVFGPDNLAPTRIDSTLSEPLFGTEDQPHWLTKLLLLQILGVDTSTGIVHQTQPLPQTALASPARQSEEAKQVPPTSRTHSRSEVISIWGRVGELCRLAGDECSWRAIGAALCSRPVARLDKAWKRVERPVLSAIEGWVYPTTGNSNAPVSVCEPKLTIWGGDIRSRIREALGKATNEDNEQVFKVPSLKGARALFEDFRTAFSLCPRRVPVAQDEVNDDTRRMIAFWRDIAAEGGGATGFAAKFQRVEQFMSLSLAAEPRRKGLFEPYFWSRSSSYQPHTPLVPLLFPEALPTACFVDRAQLLRGRVDSDVSDPQLRRAVDPHRQPPYTNRPDQNDLLKGLSQGGTVIPVYNGDLLLSVQKTNRMDSTPDSRPSSSRLSSRPPSSAFDSDRPFGRTPSMRVKPGSSQGLERKTSLARRNSLPSISQRQNVVTSEFSSEPPLRVVVQAGTLNVLVTLLVHGLPNVSVSVADDNGEMSLREGMTRELVLDEAEFAKVWWTAFRSFVSPFVFFELLRKLYITAQPFESSPAITDYARTINARTKVLDTIKEWLTLGGGSQDLLDESQLYQAVHSFLHNPSDHVIYESKNFLDPNVQQCLSRLKDARQSLTSTFSCQTMRPLNIRGPPIRRGSINTVGTRGRILGMREPPDIDHFDAEEFVDNLNGMAAAVLSNVGEEDLYVTADILEVQSSDRTGWFSLREASSVEEGVDIQTIYSHIQDVENSTLISELYQDSLYRMLPPSIRSCVRAYGIIRKWIVSKIVVPRLGLRIRQNRMEFLLRAIEIARLRNSDLSYSPVHLPDQPCIRSFVEAVITSAILSVESRLHVRAWQNVALTRGVQCDSLASLLSRPVQPMLNQESLIPDMGWVLERILEIIATPDAVENISGDALNLVNFDKRRHLCNFIEKAPGLPALQRQFQPDEFNRRGFERLNNVEKEVINLQFDHRGIKDEATREASQTSVGTPSGRKLARPFQRLVIAQLDKNRRDKNMRSRLQKEKLHEQSKIEKRDEQLNRAMRPRKPTIKQHRNKKSMSALFNFMRPISSAFVADTPALPGGKKTAAELDFIPSGKPSLVLSIVDARVAQFINNERSFTFQLNTEDGGHYILQALNKREMTRWIETVSKVARMAAKRRLTYLGSSPKPQLSDHIHSHLIVPSRDPKAVFGVELDFLLMREAGGQPVQPAAVPLVIEQCLSEVESRGLSEVGIYRIAGAVSEINNLKDSFNRGESPINATTDIHAVCDLVKTWFRVLPDPVFPSSSYYDVIQAMQLENLDNRLSRIRTVVQALPQANFDLLRRVSEHLDKVTDFEEQNHMTAEALAIVFSPNLLRSPHNDFSMILTNMGHTHKLVKALITHFHVIFDEADHEAEPHSEDEYDSPILEEDEEDENNDLHVPSVTEPETASS